MFERTHPYMILSNLWQVLYLVIIPVLRGFLSALQKDLFAWITGAWIDILILLFMVTVSVLRWYVLTYRLDGRTIRVRSGILYRRDTVILWEKVTSVTVVESFYLRPFRAAHVRADTMGGSYKSADLNLFLSRDKARAALEMAGSGNGADVTRQYVPRAVSILAMSLITSNSFAGILFISTFVSQSGKLLGNEFSNMIVSTFEDLARKLAFGVPPAAAAIAYVLLGGWLIGFLNTFISYRGFVIRRRNSTISIQGGAATRRQYALRYDRINFLDIRRNILALVFRLYTLYISAVGYGKGKDGISCIIPSEYAEGFARNCQMLFPDYVLSQPSVKSPKAGIFRFISQPLAACVAIPAALWVLVALFPTWSSFISFACLMLLIPAGMFLAVRLVAWRSGGAGRAGSFYTMSYSSGFNIHTVIVPESKIVGVKLRRSLFQVRGKSGTCDLIVRTAAERHSSHLLRNLPLAEAERLFGMEGSGG